MKLWITVLALSVVACSSDQLDGTQVTGETPPELMIAAGQDSPALEAENELLKPEPVEPESPLAEPEILKPEVTQPEVTQPEVSDPEISDPEVSSAPDTSQSVDPEQTDPLLTAIPVGFTVGVEGDWYCTVSSTPATGSIHSDWGQHTQLKFNPDRTVDINEEPTLASHWFYVPDGVTVQWSNTEQAVTYRANNNGFGGMSDGESHCLRHLPSADAPHPDDFTFLMWDTWLCTSNDPQLDEEFLMDIRENYAVATRPADSTPENWLEIGGWIYTNYTLTANSNDFIYNSIGNTLTVNSVDPSKPQTSCAASDGY